MQSYLLHRVTNEVEDIKVEEIKPTEKDAQKLCADMLRIRHMDMLLERLYSEKKIRGFCHLGIGQESIPVGISMYLDAEDSLVASYRCHGVALVSGMDPKEIVCEQLGSSDGCCKGKGGSMHLFGKRFFGGHGIVGAQIPIAAGLAFAEKYKKLLMQDRNKNDVDNSMSSANKTDQSGGIGEWTIKLWQRCKVDKVTVVLFGDGAANQGQFYETINMAALWGLPIVFVCENNEYGMGTSVTRASASKTVYDRFSFIPGIHVDGSCVFKVGSAFKYARKHAVEKGPIILEISTYRFVHHSITDTATSYRSDAEINDKKKKDPIECIKQHMGVDSEEAYRKLVYTAEKEMVALGDVCIKAPRCKEHDLMTHILM